jgi:hypothetical protein
MNPTPATPSAPGAEPSLARLVEGLQREGFTHSFRVEPDGTVNCPSCGKTGPTSALHVHSFRRFEGASDPDDEVIVVAVQWRDQPGCKGVLVLGFGPIAAPEHKIALGGLKFEEADNDGEHVPTA